MPTAILRPNSTISNGWGVNGGASAHAVLGRDFSANGAPTDPINTSISTAGSDSGDFGLGGVPEGVTSVNSIKIWAFTTSTGGGHAVSVRHGSSSLALANVASDFTGSWKSDEYTGAFDPEDLEDLYIRCNSSGGGSKWVAIAYVEIDYDAIPENLVTAQLEPNTIIFDDNATVSPSGTFIDALKKGVTEPTAPTLNPHVILEATSQDAGILAFEVENLPPALGWYSASFWFYGEAPDGGILGLMADPNVDPEGEEEAEYFLMEFGPAGPGWFELEIDGEHTLEELNDFGFVFVTPTPNTEIKYHAAYFEVEYEPDGEAHVGSFAVEVEVDTDITPTIDTSGGFEIDVEVENMSAASPTLESEFDIGTELSSFFIGFQSFTDEFNLGVEVGTSFDGGDIDVESEFHLLNVASTLFSGSATEGASGSFDIDVEYDIDINSFLEAKGDFEVGSVVDTNFIGGQGQVGLFNVVAEASTDFEGTPSVQGEFDVEGIAVTNFGIIIPSDGSFLGILYARRRGIRNF